MGIRLGSTLCEGALETVKCCIRSETIISHWVAQVQREKLGLGDGQKPKAQTTGGFAWVSALRSWQVQLLISPRWFKGTPPPRSGYRVTPLAFCLGPEDGLVRPHSHPE